MTIASTHPVLVVGFDGSAASRRALAWAAEEAQLREGQLEIVRAWSPGEFGSDEEQAVIAQKTLYADVEAVMEATNAPWTATAVMGRPTAVLSDRARYADMLVVGSRRKARVAGLALGSVSQHLVGHMSAPQVIVVRDDQE